MTRVLLLAASFIVAGIINSVLVVLGLWTVNTVFGTTLPITLLSVGSLVLFWTVVDVTRNLSKYLEIFGGG
jgi:hypothetical protein